MRRRTTTIAAIVIAFSFVFTSMVMAMGGSHGKGDPKSPISSSGWSAGLTELINREDRIGGSWVNQFDAFEYAGDATTFNAFLQKYAKLPEEPHHLTLRPIDKTTTRPLESDGDWYLSIDSHWGKEPTTAGLVLMVGGKIKLGDVVLPEGITVSAMGEPLDEIQTFLSKHATAVRAPATRPIDVRRN